MEVCSVGPHFTGHDDEPIDEECIARFYDDVTGNIAARQEEIMFLNTFLVYTNVPVANAKGKERVLVQWCDVKEATEATWQSDHGMWDENLGGRIRSCRTRSLPLHPWKASGMSFTGCRLVDVFWCGQCLCQL